MRPVFRKGLGGKLRYRPSQGPPDLISETPDVFGAVTLQDPDGVAFRTDVDVDGPVFRTALNGATVVGAKQLIVDAVDGAEQGQEIWVGDLDSSVIESVDGANFKLILSRPLRYAHPDGESVSSGELSIDLEAGEYANELENALAIWKFEFGGEPVHALQAWDVCLNVFKLDLTPTRLFRYCARQLVQQSEQTIPELLDQAQWLIELWLRYAGVNPAWVVDLTEFERLGGITIRCILLGEELQHSAARERVWAIALDEWRAERDALWKIRRRWLDRNRNRIVDEGEQSTLTESLPDYMPVFTPGR